MSRGAVLALALAALPTAAQQPRPRSVSVEFTGPEIDRAAFVSSLTELLGRLDLEVGSERPLLATVRVDWTVPGEGVLTVADAAGKVVLLRRLARGEKPAVALEAAAHITQSVVEELRDEEKRRPLVASNPQAAPDPVLTVSAKKPAPARGPLALDLGGFVNGRVFGGGAPVAIGFGLSSTLALGAVRFRPALWFLGAYHAPFEVSNDWAQLSTQVVTLRLGPKVSLLGGDNWRLDTGLGAGADLFITSTRSTVLPPNTVGAVRADAAPVLTALLSGHLGLVRSADLSLGFTLDVDLAPRRYVVAVGDAREELFLPWRVRPALLLGFSFSPVGPDPYAGRGEDAP